MDLRRLTDDDAAAYRTVRQRALRDEPIAFAASPDEPQEQDLAAIRAMLAPRPDGAVFGAFAGSALVGLVGVQREALRKLSHKAVVWGLYVVPEHRGRRTGADLLSRALAHAWGPLGVEQVLLGVHTANAPALALYRAAGFEVFGTERGALRVDGSPVDEHHLVCRRPGTA